MNNTIKPIKPVITGCSTPSLMLPAMKYLSADREWVTITVPLISLSSFVKISKVRKKNEPIPKDIKNRFLDSKHKNEIKKYILDEEEFIMPPITLVSDKPMPFNGTIYDESDLNYTTEELLKMRGSISGMAFVPMGEKFECLDGNHRTAAIIELAEEYPDVLKDSFIVLNIVYETRTKKIRQDFVDVNQNGKITTASINTLFNSRDALSNIIMDLLDKFEYLKDKTDLISTSISKNSKDIYTINNIRNLIVEINGHSSQSKTSIQSFSNKIKADNELMDEVRFRSELTLELLKENQIIKSCILDESRILKVREKSIITSGAGLLILGRVIGNIFKYERDQDSILKCLNDIINYDWSRENPVLRSAVLTSKGTLSLTQSSLTDITKTLSKIIIPSYVSNYELY
ncbi:DNA sulfur modification protein DndB [Clostridium sp.]|uniref:DNA sulfur modification protein DndB n=1 Tax=Clostridium sp. TaxID=1506 RepID=UPI003F3EFF79